MAWPAGVKCVKPRLCAAGQHKRRRARRRVDHADVLHEDAALEPGPDRLGKGLLGGEALGERAGAGERSARRLGAFDVGEDTLQETLAEAIERRLDALDVAQVGADRDDHRALSINDRIRATLASSPVKIASPIRKWPMLSSASCGMAAIGRDIVERQAVAGMGLDAILGGERGRVGDAT